MKRLLFVFLLLTCQLIEAAQQKKVLVLDFINVAKNSSYGYLESSLTEAVKESLRSRFVFRETNPNVLNEVAKKNYIFRQDYFTQTAAMNFGLLAKQDVVISGGYVVTPKNKILFNVRIIDIANRKVITEREFKAKADNTIFTSVEKIAKQIAAEAKTILPSKESWSQSSAEDETPSRPLFTNPRIAMYAGGAFYAAEYADRFQPGQPALSIAIGANVPKVSERLTLSAELDYLKHTWDDDFNKITQQTSIETSNYLTGLFIGYELPLSSSLKLHPQLGGGTVLRSTEVGGSLSVSDNNTIPYGAASLILYYNLNNYLDLALKFRSSAEVETGTVTLLNSGQLGLNFRL